MTIAAGAAIVAALAGLYIYITVLNSTIDTLKLNNIQLENSVATQQVVIERQLEQHNQVVASVQQQQQMNDLLQQSIDNLRDKFDKVNASGKARDFGKLARAKPTLLETRINKGTKDALRCVEIASGAPLTEEEVNAEKPSEYNTQCPAIANPAFNK